MIHRDGSVGIKPARRELGDLEGHFGGTPNVTDRFAGSLRAVIAPVPPYPGMKGVRLEGSDNMASQVHPDQGGLNIPEILVRPKMVSDAACEPDICFCQN